MDILNCNLTQIYEKLHSPYKCYTSIIPNVLIPLTLTACDLRNLFVPLKLIHYVWDIMNTMSQLL